MKSYKTTMHNLEQDKQSLKQRVAQLELALTESQTNANIMSNVDTSGDTILTKLKAEKDAADGQVEFLNSVIVDMHRKNEELSTRLTAMESGQVMNGSGEYEFDEVK